MNTIKLEWSDICRHECRCECKNFFYHTVPNYSTYCQATHWLREHGCKLISVFGEKIEPGEGLPWRYSGRYTFKFLCEQEYMWFKLRWE
jgi:hypothetical protein